MEGFDTAAEKSEREREERGRREERAGRQLEKEAATTTGDKMGDEEGEISSGSSTPGPVSETHTVVTPRCYMDREGGGGTGAGVGETQRNR